VVVFFPINMPEKVDCDLFIYFFIWLIFVFLVILGCFEVGKCSIEVFMVFLRCFQLKTT